MPLIVDVIRDRNALYRELGGDRIENTYAVKVINLDGAPHPYEVLASGIDGLQVAEPAEAIRVSAGTVGSVVVRLRAPATQAAGVHRITISVNALDEKGIQVHEIARFIGPTP